MVWLWSVQIGSTRPIDGIDTEIRERLSDHHIHATQNLAAANPLMLFVETPYGVYQIMDWVAQAQLCCSVGPDKLTRLRAIGIRTLVDLERLALDPRCRSPRLIELVGRIILDAEISDRPGRETAAEGAMSAQGLEAIVSNIQIRLDDPHVHRLRQISIQIGTRLGMSNRRFRSQRGFRTFVVTLRRRNRRNTPPAPGGRSP